MMYRPWSGRTPGECPEDGLLRALLDAPETEPAAATHVAACPACATRMERLRADAGWVSEALARDAPAPPDVRRAWGRFEGRIAGSEEGREMDTPRPVWNRGAFRGATAALAVIALMVAFTVTPARGLADGVLERFRVQKFAVVTIPMDYVAPFQSAIEANVNNSDFQQQLDELGTFTTNLSMDSARQVGSLDEAKGIYGDFAVPDAGTLPDGFNATPNVYVSDPGTATYVLNTAKAQEIIDQLNLPIYSLPDAATSPTLTFTVDVPAAVGLEYSDAAGNRIIVAQAESPTLTVPDTLDMNDLREEILRLPGLPSDVVGQLRAIDDWQHTLIIPIPEGAQSRDVTVNGHPGLSISGLENGAGVVLWQDGGVLHVVAGQADESTLLDIAGSLD